MLTRIYISNFRCFNDFELTLDSINLLLGPNGSGKTSIFWALRNLQSFVVYQTSANELFHRSECAQNGLSSFSPQVFEIGIQHEGHKYEYQLRIAFRNEEPYVEFEQLSLDTQLLVKFCDEKVELFNRDSSFPLVSSRSALSALPSSTELKPISIFRQLLQRMIIVQVMPPLMEPTSSEETPLLEWDARNLASWYRHISSEQELSDELTEYLKEVLLDFSYLALTTLQQEPSGKIVKALEVHFVGDENGHSHYFFQLSDGQRALIALYMIMVFARRHNYILCLDEPDNFLALAEIQPWLVELYMLCSEGSIQALLISHHPEIINYLGKENGIWLERAEGGSVIAQSVADEAETGLPLSELVARGWIGA